MKLPKIKRCPHCRGVEGFVERMDICVFRVWCNTCAAQGPPAERAEYEWDELKGHRDAIRLWNCRTPAAHARVSAVVEGRP